MKVYYGRIMIGFIAVLALGLGEREEFKERNTVPVVMIKSKNQPIEKKQISSEIQTKSELKTYINKKYGITLKYPSDWKLNPLYSERYEGKEGFFQVGAINGQDSPIDTVTNFDVFHKLEPYGSAPQITKLKIQNQEARLIMPSEDQPKEMQNQAGLIIKYPKPVKIGNINYYYFVLWADKAHIEQIGQTVTFSDSFVENGQ